MIINETDNERHENTVHNDDDDGYYSELHFDFDNEHEHHGEMNDMSQKNETTSQFEVTVRDYKIFGEITIIDKSKFTVQINATKLD